MRLYVIGQTGTGGSTLLFNSTMQDARSGEGFSPIDPHDNLAESLHQNLCARITPGTLPFHQGIHAIHKPTEYSNSVAIVSSCLVFTNTNKSPASANMYGFGFGYAFGILKSESAIRGIKFVRSPQQYPQV